jgi:hypothetical protein
MRHAAFFGTQADKSLPSSRLSDHDGDANVGKALFLQCVMAPDRRR